MAWAASNTCCGLPCWGSCFPGWEGKPGVGSLMLKVVRVVVGLFGGFASVFLLVVVLSASW